MVAIGRACGRGSLKAGFGARERALNWLKCAQLKAGRSRNLVNPTQCGFLPRSAHLQRSRPP